MFSSYRCHPRRRVLSQPAQPSRRPPHQRPSRLWRNKPTKPPNPASRSSFVFFVHFVVNNLRQAKPTASKAPFPVNCIAAFSAASASPREIIPCPTAKQMPRTPRMFSSYRCHPRRRVLSQPAQPLRRPPRRRPSRLWRNKPTKPPQPAPSIISAPSSPPDTRNPIPDTRHPIPASRILFEPEPQSRRPLLDHLRPVFSSRYSKPDTRNTRSSRSPRPAPRLPWMPAGPSSCPAKS